MISNSVTFGRCPQSKMTTNGAPACCRFPFFSLSRMDVLRWLRSCRVTPTEALRMGGECIPTVSIENNALGRVGAGVYFGGANGSSQLGHVAAGFSQ